MCSIAAFSFSNKSHFDARRLASALLIEGEKRGKHATGYAYPRGAQGILGNSAASRARLFVKSHAFDLPAEAKTAILHTRYATQGKPENNLNNHPVYAFGEGNNAVAAVHNGMIWNDWSLFSSHKGDFERIAQVDSEIIPQLLAHYGSENYAKTFTEIEGSVASAWLDETTGDTLHIVRASDSPVHVVHVDEPRRMSRRGNKRPRLLGVIIASTEAMIAAALTTLGLSIDGRYVKHYVLSEGQYMSVTEGVWNVKVTTFDLPEPTYTGGRWDDDSLGGWGGRSAWSTGSYKAPGKAFSGASAYGFRGTESTFDKSNTLGYTEGYDSASGSSYLAHADGTIELFGGANAESDGSEFEAEKLPTPADAEWWEDHYTEDRGGSEFQVTTVSGETRFMTLAEVLDAEDAGELTREAAEIFMHLEFCNETECVLNTPETCNIMLPSLTPKEGKHAFSITDQDVYDIAIKALQDTP